MRAYKEGRPLPEVEAPATHPLHAAIAARSVRRQAALRITSPTTLPDA